MGLAGQGDLRQEVILHLEPDQAIKALGFWVSAKGDVAKTIEELTCLAWDWA